MPQVTYFVLLNIPLVVYDYLFSQTPAAASQVQDSFPWSEARRYVQLELMIYVQLFDNDKVKETEINSPLLQSGRFLSQPFFGLRVKVNKHII